MPNWCMNKLNVKGDADVITEFIETILVPKEDESGFVGIEPFFDEGKYRELTPSDEVDSVSYTQLTLPTICSV